MAKGERVRTSKIFDAKNLHARDGTSLFYEISGKGEFKLMLLDGLACDGFVWKRLIPYFASKSVIIHPHYRGHGKSGKPKSPQTRIMNLVEDIILISENENLSDAIVLGHSMGVQVAIEIARFKPEMVRGIVLINGGYGKLLSTFQDTQIAVHLLPLLKFLELNYPDFIKFFWENFPVSLAYKMALRLRQINPVLTRKQDIMVYLKHLKKVDLRVFLSLLEEIQYYDASPYLGEIKCPALIIAGEKDLFTPPQIAKTMASMMPDAEFFVVRGGTHIVPLELPEMVNLAIEKFIDEKCHV